MPPPNECQLNDTDRKMLALHHIVWPGQEVGTPTAQSRYLANLEEAWGKLPDSPECELCGSHDDIIAMRNGGYICGGCRAVFEGAAVTINNDPEPGPSADQWKRLLAVCDSWQREARFWRRMCFVPTALAVVAAVLLCWTLKG